MIFIIIIFKKICGAGLVPFFFLQTSSLDGTTIATTEPVQRHLFTWEWIGVGMEYGLGSNKND
jgi:hypothetical protein